MRSTAGSKAGAPRIVAKARTQGGEIEFLIDPMAQGELEGAGQNLALEIHRNHLQTVSGGLEAGYRGIPQVGCPIIPKAFGGRWEKGFSTASTLKLSGGRRPSAGATG